VSSDIGLIEWLASKSILIGFTGSSCALFYLGAFLLGCITNLSVSASFSGKTLNEGSLDNPTIGLKPRSMDTPPLEGAAQQIIELNLKWSRSLISPEFC
jgi:hypothetical protein